MDSQITHGVFWTRRMLSQVAPLPVHGYIIIKLVCDLPLQSKLSESFHRQSNRIAEAHHFYGTLSGILRDTLLMDSEITRGLLMDSENDTAGRPSFCTWIFNV